MATAGSCVWLWPRGGPDTGLSCLPLFPGRRHDRPPVKLNSKMRITTVITTMIKRTVSWILILMANLMLCMALQAADNQPREIEWEDLIPDGYNADLIVAEYDTKYRLSELADDDPILKEMMAKIDAAYKAAPVKPELNNALVKIPGYVVPLETDGKRTSEFLLVPYFGACIHVPPPPANQTILVRTKEKEGAEIRKLYDVVWVTGVLKTELFVGDLAHAGYRIDAHQVDPY
ncbi:MAG: DUF3299 domain-containing protein [Ketobacter sp.]|nr:MAG: DUF3299 domain-containing protein [Ketobacter sp.]